jgi:hypothetical protein
MAMRKKFYITTFCNFAHNVKTGRPIGHECYILPVSALRAEMAGDYDKAISILRTKGKGPVVDGRKLVE